MNKTTIDGSVKPVSKQGVGVWNQIPYDDGTGNGAKKVAESMYTSGSITSKLIDSSGWDRTLDWLYETGEKSVSEILIDSISWGNYEDDTFSNTTGLITTGQFNETKANNIFDLAGNVYEWTTGVYNTDDKVVRGGHFFSYYGRFPVSDRNRYSTSDTSYYIGFRVALYL